MTTPIQRSREKTPAEKAQFHHVTGAGKSKVKRQFFGFAPDDEPWLHEELTAALDRNLRRSEG